MIRLAGKKSLRIPRLALMLVLAMGLLAQSLLEMSGQTHEALLHADAGEAYTHHHEPHGHEAPPAGDSDHPAGDTLHLLMHQPCSGHCIWMPGAPGASVLAATRMASDSFDVSAPAPAADYAAPFRPPRA